MAGENWLGFYTETDFLQVRKVKTGSTLIGEGGDSRVIRSFRMKTGEQVAIKIFKPSAPRDAAHNEEVATRMLDYLIARIDFLLPSNLSSLATLPSDAIQLVAPLDLSSGQVKGHADFDRYQMIIEAFLGRTNLFNLLYKQVGDRLIKIRYSPYDTLEMVKLVFLIVAVFNQHGLVHRDLKPENIVYDDRKKRTEKELPLKLCDFSSARLALELDGSEPVAGTFGYVAPEMDKANGEDFVLLSMAPAEKVRTHHLKRISREHSNKPVLIYQDGDISLYGCHDKYWKLTQLDTMALMNIQLPDVSEPTVMREIPLSKKIRDEIQEKKVHQWVMEPEKPKSYPFILMVIKADEKVDTTTLHNISKRHDKLPILIKQNTRFSFYGCYESVWGLTALDGRAFTDIYFPTENGSTAIFPYASLSSAIRREIIAKKAHSDARGNNFAAVDNWSAGVIGFEIKAKRRPKLGGSKPEKNYKDKFEKSFKEKLMKKAEQIRKNEIRNRELTREEVFELMPDVVVKERGSEEPRELEAAFLEAFEIFKASLAPGLSALKRETN